MYACANTYAFLCVCVYLCVCVWLPAPHPLLNTLFAFRFLVYCVYVIYWVYTCTYIHVYMCVCVCMWNIYVGVCTWPLTLHPVLVARLLLLTLLRVHIVSVYVHTCINTCECVRVSVCVAICATPYSRRSFYCYCRVQGPYTPGTLLFF